MRWAGERWPFHSKLKESETFPAPISTRTMDRLGCIGTAASFVFPTRCMLCCCFQRKSASSDILRRHMRKGPGSSPTNKVDSIFPSKTGSRPHKSNTYFRLHSSVAARFPGTFLVNFTKRTPGGKTPSITIIVARVVTLPLPMLQMCCRSCCCLCCSCFGSGRAFNCDCCSGCTGRRLDVRCRCRLKAL